MGKIEEVEYIINNKKVTIRNGKVQDAEKLINLIKRVGKETDFLLKDPDEFNPTVKEEEKFIQTQLDSEVDALIVAETDREIIGICGLNGNTNKKIRHSAEFVLAIQQEFCGMGIGKKLMKAGIEWGKENGISRITLKVDTNNYRAISLYLKLGFEIEGTLRNDKMLLDGSYISGYTMTLLL